MSLLEECHSLNRRSYCDEKINSLSWNHYMHKFWKFLWDTLSVVEEFEESVNSLLDNLMQHDCKDLLLSSNLIHFIAVYRNSEGFENRGDRVAKALIAFIRRGIEEVEEYHHCMDVNSVHIIFALRRSDVKLLQLFMKYGVLVLSSDRRDEKNEIMHALKRFCFHLIGVEQIYGDLMMPRERIIAASDNIAELFYREVSSLDSKGHRRLMLQLLGVDAILKKRRGDATYQDYAECIRIYFRDIRWPFLSTTEIRSFLYKFGSLKPLFIESLCHVFNEVFPETLGTPYEPRSLKELCRVEAREVIMYESEQTLPGTVSDLYIPHTLRDYLLGEE